MYRAKRGGADRIEVFGRQMQGRLGRARGARERPAQGAGEEPASRPLPAHRLSADRGARRIRGGDPLGSSAARRHQSVGTSSRSPRIPISSSSSARTCCMRAARDAARWQKEHPRVDAPLFVSASMSRAASSSARTSFRRSGTSSAATSCRRARSSSRSPSSWRWRIRSRRPRSWNGSAAPAPRSRSTISARAIRRSPISSDCRSTPSRSTRRSCSRAAPTADRRALCAPSWRSRTSSARRWSRRASRAATEIALPALDRLRVRARRLLRRSHCRHGGGAGSHDAAHVREQEQAARPVPHQAQEEAGAEAGTRTAPRARSAPASPLPGQRLSHACRPRPAGTGATPRRRSRGPAAQRPVAAQQCRARAASRRSRSRSNRCRTQGCARGPRAGRSACSRRRPARWPLLRSRRCLPIRRRVTAAARAAAARRR